MEGSHSDERNGKVPMQGLRAEIDKIITVPYFSPASLAGFDATCDRGLEQMLYLHALIEEDNAQSSGRSSVAGS